MKIFWILPIDYYLYEKNNNRIFCWFVYLLICLFIHKLQWQILVFTNRPWDQTNLVLNSIEKVKPVFFYFFFFLCFLNWAEQNSDLTAFTSKIHVFCRTEWSKGGTPWKRILTIFKYKNEYHEELELKTWTKKMESLI